MTETSDFVEESAVKRKRGRPRKQADAAAPSPESEKSQDAFFARLASVADDQILYVYRLDPVIDLTLVGRDQNYIDKVPVRSLTDEYMIENHAPGRFMVQVPGSFSGKLNYYDPRLLNRKPPFDLAAVADVSANAWWIKKWTSLGYWPPAGRKEEEDMASNNTAVAALAATVEGLRQDLRQLREAPQAAQNDKFLEMLIADNRDLKKQIHEIQMEAMKRSSAGAGPITTIREAIEAQQELQDILAVRRGSGNGGAEEEMTVAAAIYKGIREIAPQLLAVVKDWRTNAATAPTPAVVAVEATTIAAPPSEETPEMLQILKINRLLKSAIELFERGKPGTAFATFLVDVELEGEIYDQLSDLIARDPQQAIAFITARPEWQAIAARDAQAIGRLPAWLAEFSAAYEDDGEEDQLGEDAAAAPAPPATATPTPITSKRKKEHNTK